MSEYAKAIMVRVDEEMLERVSAVQRRLALSQSNAIRMLIARGLEAVEREAKVGEGGDAPSR